MTRRWALVILLLAGSARAQAPAPADPLAEGKRQFELARTELNLGHFEQAREHFEASYRLTGRAALLYNLGYVERKLFERTRKLEHLEQAAERMRSFLRAVGRDGDVGARAERELREIEDLSLGERAARARGEEVLALGESLLRQGRPDLARRELERFDASEGIERSGVARALMLRASIAAESGDQPAAEKAFAQALSLTRDLALPTEAGEATRRAFSAVRALAASPLAVEHAPPASLAAGRSVTLGFKLRGQSDAPRGGSDAGSLVTGFRVSYRAGRQGAFSTLALERVGDVALPTQFTATLLPGANLQYFGEMIGPGRSILEHLGTAALPFSVDVAGARKPSVARRWWFWVATVGAVAAAGTAVGLGVHYGTPAPTRIPLATELVLVK